jgi:hypothetical protein
MIRSPDSRQVAYYSSEGHQCVIIGNKEIQVVFANYFETLHIIHRSPPIYNWHPSTSLSCMATSGYCRSGRASLAVAGGRGQRLRIFI